VLQVDEVLNKCTECLTDVMMYNRITAHITIKGAAVLRVSRTELAVAFATRG
jgi:hypothetical protein